MLGTVLTWWATQMLGWLPAGGDGVRDTMLAEAMPGRRLRLSHRRRGVESELGVFAADAPALRAALRAGGRRRTVVLRLAPGAVLERDVELPAAAERELGNVLGFEMDRLTPFRADAVHWTWTVLRRDRARNQVAVRLHLVPRAGLADAMATLAAAGAVPVAAETAGGVVRVPLGDAAGASTWRRSAVGGLAVACALLAVVAAGLPFVAQEGRAGQVEARIEALRPAVREAEALRRVASGGAGADVVGAERARLGNAMQVLAALTDVLPDDTVLTELTLRGGQLAVSGQSAAAVRLIGALAANPVFRNPAFSAPVTRAEARGGAGAGAGGQRELFSLRADAGSAPAATGGR